MCWELKWGSIVPAGGKRGNEDGVVWFHLLAGASILPPHAPALPLSVKALIRNSTPQWQIQPAIKGRKRKALLSAADWDPRLPSHMCDVRVCACTYAWFRASGRADTAAASSPIFQVFPRLTFLLRVLKQQQINAAVRPSLPLPCTHMHYMECMQSKLQKP